MRRTWETNFIGGRGRFSWAFTATSALADGLDYFEKQLEPFRHKPSFSAPGPAFDAKKCMAGKSIFSIPVTSAVPFITNIEKAMTASAAEVGFKFTVWENQGQISQWVQGMDTAVNQKVSLIDLLAGSDPRVLMPQMKAAAAMPPFRSWRRI